MFSLKKWNAVAMWSWDVECDTCAICRVQVMGKRLPAGPGPPWPPSPPLGGGCPPGQPALPRGCPPSGDAASGPVWPCPSFTLPRPPGSEGRSRFLRRPSLRRPREGSGRGARSPHRGLSRPVGSACVGRGRQPGRGPPCAMPAARALWVCGGGGWQARCGAAGGRAGAAVLPPALVLKQCCGRIEKYVFAYLSTTSLALFPSTLISTAVQLT